MTFYIITEAPTFCQEIFENLPKNINFVGKSRTCLDEFIKKCYNYGRKQTERRDFFVDMIKEADFRREIANAPRAGYLLFGEEDYLKAHAVATARNAICPDETFAVFNEIRLDALDFDAQRLQDALLPLPMMAERKLITVTGLNFNTMRPSELDALCEVLSLLPEYDYNTVILTVAADALDLGMFPKRPSATYKALAACLVPVMFERCTPQKLNAWVGKHFAHHGIEVTPAFAATVIEYCGRSMFTLANEIEKLSFYLKYHGRTSPTDKDLHTVCIPSTEYDAFSFANAMMNRNREVALAILADYRMRRVEPVIILSEVIRVFCEMLQVRAMTKEGATASAIASATKIHEFRVGLYQKSLRQGTDERPLQALRECVAADAALKLSPQGYTALERLVCTV